MAAKSTPDNLIFYDGDCGFCNSSVQFVLNHKKKPFYFAPLQSKTGREILESHGVQVKLDTIYYLKKGKLFDRSSAALQITRRLKGLYPALFIFYFVPKFLRDPFYNLIARNRHKLGAPHCAIPQPEDEEYFIKE